MKDAQKPDHISLTTLVMRLREGRYVIPDFQREFEWEPRDIRELVRSIFLDYYIGSLLLWKGKPENFAALACEPIYAYRGDGKKEHIVLDGQQRLTAMHYVFFAPEEPPPNRSNRCLYFIKVDQFMDGAYDDAFVYRWTRDAVTLLANPISQYKQHMFPVSVVGKGGWELPNWVQGYENYWSHEQKEAQAEGKTSNADEASRRTRAAKAFGEHLKAITEQYQISFVELDRDLDIDKVCDIFTQINSRGTRLDVFDLVNALLRPKGLKLKELWRKAKSKMDFIDHGRHRMNVYLLQVMSILLQGYCSSKYLYYLLPGQEKQVRDPDGSLRKEILIPDIETFERRWDEAVEAVEKAIKRLRQPREYGAIASRYLPYVSILPAFAALQTALRALPATRQPDAQDKLRHWYWASVFTNRYSGSVESTGARDYLDVKAWFEEGATEPDFIAEFRERIDTLDLRRQTKRGTSVYNGLFNLLIRQGARDWVSDGFPQYDDLDDHHIVPKSWGKKMGVGDEIDTILNRTPLTAHTNRDIVRDYLPNQYLYEMIKRRGESKVRATLETHFVSSGAFDVLLRKPFTERDFKEFLGERQRTFQHAIRKLLV